VGLSGVGIALGALAQRFLGAGYLPWLDIVGSTERYNFSFFHHSGAAACLDFAWPLLAFRVWGKEPSWVGRVLLWASLALLAALCFPLWRSESAWAIAIGLALAGGAWLGLVQLKRASPRLILSACGLALVTAFAWQFIEVQKMRADFPDGWVSAEVTRATASERDAVLRTRAAQRGDHLALSPAPPRPAAWLTGMRMAAAYPLVGDGPGSWVRNAVLYSNDPIVNTFYQHRQFAHHDLLQTAAEWGVVPALTWMLLWIGGFYRAIGRDPAGAGEIALVLALFGLALHSLIHFPLQIPALQLWAALLLGLAWSRRPRKSMTANELSIAGGPSRSAREKRGGGSPRSPRSGGVRSRRARALED
jgi:hypothetical protein